MPNAEVVQMLHDNLHAK